MRDNRHSLATILIAAAALMPLAPAGVAAQRWRDSDRWTWSGAVESGRWLYIRNLNGAIRVEPASGNAVEITAIKSWRRGNPNDVKITVQQRGNGRDVVICAIWYDRGSCDEDGYHQRRQSRDWWDWFGDNKNNNDVNVEFTVRLPKGVRIAASTVNGGLEIDGVDSEVDANTTNGSIVARSNGGPVRARTTNGELRIRTGVAGSERLEYSTTNGSITVEIPESTNADVELHTVNGSISTDFPITIDGSFNHRRLRGTLGRGGQPLRLSTVNGSIRLRKG